MFVHNLDMFLNTQELWNLYNNQTLVRNDYKNRGLNFWWSCCIWQWITFFKLAKMKKKH